MRLAPVSVQVHLPVPARRAQEPRALLPALPVLPVLLVLRPWALLALLALLVAAPSAVPARLTEAGRPATPSTAHRPEGGSFAPKATSASRLTVAHDPWRMASQPRTRRARPSEEARRRLGASCAVFEEEAAPRTSPTGVNSRRLPAV